ncbi:hypothetical protein [Nocardioides marmorisolisilvae]|uniref:Uncharacterized protein n=1 Tax=Nocardioides marmorisolisilvae TaxID=1542737 RepID=A0A3N0DUL8_9ACTN|nr:hypothetical protein [Nocardioides marmorisolisilvae]RNL79290.1 hypothetical protein EFL95_09815 [Nocardioides marmorisolisilvae]
MNRTRSSVLVVALAAAVAIPGTGAVGASTPVGKPIAGTSCHPFPASNWWHADIRSLPVHRSSRTWLSHMSTSVRLHPDFGPSYGDGPNYGIPITVVDGSHPKASVTFDYSDESDHVGYPLGNDTKIEGGRNSSGDKHAIVVDSSTCRLYETWNTRVVSGSWRAGSGATWSLTSNALRPNGWTSADAAGLPILPGLLRYNEVAGGYVDHAIRFTTNLTSSHHYWPARHDAGSTSSWVYPPMGTRFRLKSSYDSSKLSWQARVVVAAMKRYGLVLADNGSPWYFQGEQDARWGDQLISDLKKIPASAFVAVDTSSLVP